MPVLTLDDSRLQDRVSDATLAKMKFMSGMLDGLRDVAFRVTVKGASYDIVFDADGKVTSSPSIAGHGPHHAAGGFLFE